MTIIKPYDLWREERIAEAGRKACDLLESGVDIEPQEIECADCKGEGSVSCDCNCPRCEGWEDCDTCDGRGHIEANDPLVMEEVEKDKANRSEYLRELVSDLVALSEWMGKPKMYHVVEAGLSPATIFSGDMKIIVIHDPDRNFKEISVTEEIQYCL